MNAFVLKPSQCLLSLFLLSGLLTITALAADNRQAPLRKEKMTAIVLHAIGGPVCKNNRVVFTEAPGDAAHWKQWFERQPSVSIHYIVDRKGEIAQSIDENRVAWHANDYNQRSIGIELVNKGDGLEAFPDQQIAALTTLVKAIMARHQMMTKQGILRHSDIDSRQFICGGRKIDLKQDPGQRFPYEAFISQF